MKDVVSKTVQIGENVFEMKLSRSAFLVKNFTSANIKVKLGDNDTQSTIGSQCYQVVFNNTDNDMLYPVNTKKVTVTAEQTGLVEVESMEF